MSGKNKYFAEAPKNTDRHPRIRAWRSFRRKPMVQYVEVEIKRDREGLTVLPARLFVHFCDTNGDDVHFDEALWEPELDEWLIDEQQAKATTIDMEKLRFSLLLKPRLRPILVRYGDGYFNSVLVEEVRNGPSATHKAVEKVLADIREDAPHRGASWDECRESIEDVLKTTAKQILKLYPSELSGSKNRRKTKSEDILGGAIALYLDDRFGVTNRRLLGFT